MNKSEIITGQLVVEGGKVSLQREDGSLVELSKSDRIEVFSGGKFEPAPYSRILEKVDSAGWPLYAGLHASAEKIHGDRNSLRPKKEKLNNSLPIIEEVSEFTMPNGTKGKLKLSYELIDYTPDDFEEAMNFIYGVSHRFYMSVGKKIGYVHQDKPENPELAEIAWELFCKVEKGRITEELVQIGADFICFAANIECGVKDNSGYEKVAPERELHRMGTFNTARLLYYMVKDGRTWEELHEIGKWIKKHTFIQAFSTEQRL
ncbi:hypothetical protein [Paenibacillus alvei]|uniref:hypothetical protein n=1 Tax=Paenibacillus alvei TaxID=44250 RepID=UPI001F50C6F8|nr:hypothetical protein [Paenibacillus alvei]